MPLPKIIADFRADILLHKGFISRAYVLDAGGIPLTSENEREFIVESAFLRMFVAWESFLEHALIDYLLGEPSISGRAPVRFVTPASVSHCAAILIGTQRYVDWANPEIVRKLTQLYLDQGDPLASVIASIQVDLFDLKTLRNAAAHSAGTTAHALDALASRKLNKQCVGIHVTTLLLALDRSSNPPATILDYYLNLLDTAAEQIVTWR